MTSSPIAGSTFFGLDISQFAQSLLSIRRRISKRVLLLEFASDSLLLAEATLTQAGVKLDHLSSYPLPPEALDRGVPAEPLKMASLLQAFCTEKKIPAHRAAVVLPPELAFQRLLDLPAHLTTDQAREYVLNPSNGLQIPFPLTQTDFDLFPVSRPTEEPSVSDSHLYMLTAVPEVLVDPIVEMLKAADLELQLLDLGSYSQLRNFAADLITLSPRQVDLVLELLPDCSNLLLVSCSGLLDSDRLAAIRNIPELDIDPEQTPAALESGLNAESFLFNDESYLPISDLDLRVLVADLRDSLERLHLKFPGAEIRRLILTGPNSSHPSLAALLAETLDISVVLAQDSDVTGFAGLSLGNLLVKSGLGRLIGLALGLLPSEQLTACSLRSHLINDQNPQPQKNTVAIADLLSSRDSQVPLESVRPETQSVPSPNENARDATELSLVVDVEPKISLGESEYSVIDVSIEDADRSDELLLSSPADVDVQDSKSSLIPPLDIQEVPVEISLEETSSDLPLENEVVSSSSLNTDSSLDYEIVDDLDSLTEQWPSISRASSGDVDETTLTSSPDSLQLSQQKNDVYSDAKTSKPDVSVSEIESPPYSPVESFTHGFEDDLELHDNSSVWPSIASNNNQDLNSPTSVIETSDKTSSVSDDFVGDSIPDHTSNFVPAFDSQSFSAETSDLPSQTTDPIIQQGEELIIPGLNVSKEIAETEEYAEKDLPTAEDLAAPDANHSLGELRFAEDD